MNAIAPMRRKEVGAQSATSKRPDVAGIIREITKPARIAKEVSRLTQLARKFDHVPDVERDRIDQDFALRYSTQANQLVELLPEVDELERWKADLLVGVSRASDELLTRLMAGVLLDAFPSKVSDGAATFADMLVVCLEDLEPDGNEDFRGFPRHMPAAAIAAAIRELVEKNTFRPAISEVIAACRKHRAAMFHASRWIEMLSRRSMLAREIVAEIAFEDVSAIPEDNSEVPF